MTKPPTQAVRAASKSDTSRTTLIALFAVPFVVFYWAMPWLSSRTLGNDYGRYSIPQQLLLQFSLANGSFPIYVPRFAGGQSASAATLGQLHHPISHLAARFPGYWDGYAVDIYTALCLLSLGFVLWALYRMLREAAVDGPLAFVGSFVTVFNMRMLALFDYGASLQSYLGYLLLCVAVMRWFLHGPAFGRAVCIIAATYLVLCSGHPQMAYLGFAGAILALVCIPFVLPVIARGPIPARRTIVVWLAGAAVCMVLGTLLASAYLAPFAFDFLPSATQRTGRDFAWVYTPFGTRSLVSLLHSLFRPFASDVLGSFGGPAVLVVPVLLPLVVLVRRPPAAILLTWLVAMAVLALALAETLPLYYLAWKYLPLFSSFRAPGRVTMMVPFLLLLVFVWATRAAPAQLRIGSRIRAIPLLALLGAAATLLYAAYALLSFPSLDALELAPPARLHTIPAAAVSGVYVLGVASLALLAAYSVWPGRVVAAVLILAVVSQTTLVLRFGTWITEKQPTKTWEDLVRQHRLGVGSNEDPGAGMTAAILVELRHALAKRSARHPPARLYWQVHHTPSREEAYSILRRGNVGVATVEDHPDIARPPFPRLSNPRPGTSPQGAVRLVHGTFNRFQFHVQASHAGLFVLGEPFSTNWKATVGGFPTPTSIANGAWVGLPIPAGDSVVDLRYDSAAARAGMLVSATTAWMIAVAGALRLRRRGTRIAASLAATLAAILLFTAWQGSLHGGRHLGTHYQWKIPKDTPRGATPPS